MDATQLSALEQALVSASGSELARWSQDVLGEKLTFDDTDSTAALASALLGRCRERAALEALYDAVARERSALRHAATNGRRTSQHDVAKSLGPFTIEQRLGQGTFSSVFAAQRGAERVRLRKLTLGAGADRSDLQRYLRVTRAVARLSHHALPTLVEIATYDGSDVVAHRLVAGTTAGRDLARGAEPLMEIWPLLDGVLQALQALHDAGLAHGSLHTQNLLLAASGDPLLLDAGSHFLRAHRPEREWPAHALESTAPELLHGEEPAAPSDLYAFGVLLYRLLAGAGPFSGVSRDQLFAAQLTRDPEPLSFLVKTGHVPAELDELALELLDKDPRRRPQRAVHVQQRLIHLTQSVRRSRPGFSDAELDERTRALLDEPASALAAAVLEASVDQGADPVRVAEAFSLAAELLPPEAEARQRERLTLRAAALFERGGELGAAERAYRSLLSGGSASSAAQSELERLLRDAGRYDELIELLVDELDSANDAADRAARFENVGQLLEETSGDAEQALVAYTQALLADPENQRVAVNIERLADGEVSRWTEVLETLAQGEHLSPALMLRMAEWYRQRLLRPDAALACLQAVLSVDPRHDGALRELGELYQAGGSFAELLGVLLHRADATEDAAAARELYVQAAEVLDEALGQPGPALQLYARVFAEDPGHARACHGVQRLRERAGDYPGVADALERRAAAVTGRERHAALCAAGRVADERLNDVERAIRLYEAAAAEAPADLEALECLEALYRRARRTAELHKNLQHQRELASSPRHYVDATLKLASFAERELLSDEQAVALCRDALLLDPENLRARRDAIRFYERLGDWKAVVASYEGLLAYAQDAQEIDRAERALAAVLVQRLDQPRRALDVWERVLEREPRDEAALQAVAELASRLGDEARALRAVKTLAEGPGDPARRAELWLDAARRCEALGDLGGARESYERALELEPRKARAWSGLRRVALGLGDKDLAIQLIERELDGTDSPLGRARLYAERARIHWQVGGERRRAEAQARRALELDESCVEAHVVLADCARAAEHRAEARDHYSRALSQPGRLPAEERSRVLAAFAVTLSELGEGARALAAAEEWGAAPAAGTASALAVAEVLERHGQPARAAALCAELLTAESLAPEQRAGALSCLARARAAQGDVAGAIDSLKLAAEAAPEQTGALAALAALHRERESFGELVETLEAWAARSAPPRRWSLLAEAGEIAQQRLGDQARAQRLLRAVLAEHQGDHRALVDLLRIYTEAERWEDLLPVITELSSSRPPGPSRTPYLLTAASVAEEKLQRPKEALSYVSQALEADPDDVDALDRARRLARRTGDLALSERLHTRQIERVLEQRDERRALKLLEELYQLVSSQGDAEKTLAVCERAYALDPQHRVHADRLARLYAADPARYLERAERLHQDRIASDATRAEPYQALFDLYCAAERWDAAWCVAQALVLLRRAPARVESFFVEHQRRTAPSFAAKLAEEDWTALVRHPDVDGSVSEIFALLEPALRRARGTELVRLGLKPEALVDPAAHEAGVAGALNTLAHVFGVPLPALYLNKTQKRALAMARGREPCLVLGPAAFESLPPLQVAFTAASHLAYFRPGHGLRHFSPAVRALKTSLLAAFQLCAPELALAPELAAEIADTADLLRRLLEPEERQRLNALISGLVDHERLVDLQRWMRGVDLTSDRLGFVACGDLGTALQLVRSADDHANSATRNERCKALFRYSVDPAYFTLRERLGLAVGPPRELRRSPAA